MKKIIYMTILFIALVSMPSIFTKTFTAISSKSDAESSITTFSETDKDDLIKRFQLTMTNIKSNRLMQKSIEFGKQSLDIMAWM